MLSDDHLVVDFVMYNYKWATGYIGNSVITIVLALLSEILA
jgi:hypothetical protein